MPNAQGRGYTSPSKERNCYRRVRRLQDTWSMAATVEAGILEHRTRLTLASLQIGSGMQESRDFEARGLQPPKQNYAERRT